jgi:molybdopterin molybdotransferase
MLEFEEARRRVLSAASAFAVATEQVSLAAAAGRVLAEELLSTTPLPAFDYSAMDGYALRSMALQGQGPWELAIAGEGRAGQAPAVLPVGACLRIFTGAPLPLGADSVVIQENTERTGERVRILVPAAPGANVRFAGEDLPLGARALARGARLTAFDIGLVAALDRGAVRVARRPQLVVSCSGDELREPGSAPRAGSIPESNGAVLTALAASAGAEAQLGPRLPDDAKRATSVIGELLKGASVLVTVGGVSVGDHDVVRTALQAAGAELEFWKVALKPGKPFAFGRAGSTLILALPGNPVSAQLTFALFGMPLIRALQGDARPLPPRLRARLARPLQQKPGRLGVYRACLVGDVAHVADNQASGSTLSLARADALVFVPAECAECRQGAEVDALRLSEL